VINDEIDWAKWVDFLWVSSETCDSISHSGKIYNCWNSSEILKDDSCGLESDLHRLAGKLLPI
jgi:hypothetical protein